MRARIIRSGLALGLSLYAIAPIFPVGATAGEIDTGWGGFGDAGLLETSVPGSVFQARSTKSGLVAVGTTGDDVLIALFSDDGRPDPDAGGGSGYTTIDLGGIDVASAVANDVQYIAGTSNDRTFVARLGQPGALDPDFGDGGSVDLGLARSAQDRPFAVLVTPNRIWVARTATQACPTAPCPRAFSIHSVAPNGKSTLTWANTFGGDAVLHAVTLLPNGELIAAGSRCALGGGSCQGLLARYHATDGPITAFGTGGYRLVPEAESFSAVTTLLDGPGGTSRIYAAGSVQGDLGLMRVSEMGTVDTTFFGDGTASIGLGGVTHARSVQWLGNAAWLVTGLNGARFASAVFDGAGNTASAVAEGDLGSRGFDGLGIDEVWIGGGGVGLLGTANHAGSRRLVLTQHLATGEWNAGGWWTGQFVRYHYGPIHSVTGVLVAADGHLVATIDVATTIGQNGAYFTRLDDGRTALERGALTTGGPHFVDIAGGPDGSFSVAGWAPTTGGTTFVVEHRLASLALDDAFQAGRVTVPFLGHDQARALARQADGKLVVVGEAQGSGPVQLAMVRLTTAGTPDETFGTDGKIVDGFGNGARAYDVVIDPQGRILVGGHAFSNTGAYHLLLARFDPSGAPDPTFGVAGAVHDLAVPFDAAYVALQSDGRILVAGNSVPDPNAQLIARYLPDGRPDASFNGTGQILLRASGYQIRGLAEQQGRVWAVLGQVDGQGPARLLRYTSAGEPDLAFSNDGLAEVGLTGGFDVGGLSVGGSRIFVWGGVPSQLGYVAVIGAVESGLNRLYLPVLRR